MAVMAQEMKMNLIWHDWSAKDLNLYALYDILALRNQVSVVEQNCPYQDIDGQDLVDSHRHVAAYHLKEKWWPTPACSR